MGREGSSRSKTTRGVTGLVFITAAFAFGCGKTPAEPRPRTEPAGPLPASSAASLDAVLAAYDEIHGALARDDIESGPKGAVPLEQAATAAEKTAPVAVGAALSEVERAAMSLQTASASDADSVRRAFGEVSRAVVGLIAAAPSLRAGRHLFECPMAQGYKRWVQTSDRIANPYMGSAMLECGAGRAW